MGWSDDEIVRAVEESVKQKNFGRAIALLRRAEMLHQMGQGQFDDHCEDVPLSAVPGVDTKSLNSLQQHGIFWLAQVSDWTYRDYRNLPNIGDKTARQIDKSIVSFRRKIYAASVGECMLCSVMGRHGEADDVHEIARGSGIRSKAVRDRRAWLVLCRACHEEVGNYRLWPPERQLAIKWLADRGNYSIEFINEIRTGCRKITHDQVLEHVQRIKSMLSRDRS